MDFSKIKPAVEDISLTDEQKEQIINSCKGKKRKFNYKPLVAAAAAAVFIVVIASPGFLFRAGTADTAENEMQGDAKDNYGYLADEEICDEYVNNSSYSSGGGPVEDIYLPADFTAFSAPGFTELYSLIPSEFLHFAGDELSGWLAEVSADNGMAIMQFVIDFGIERTDFDRANIAFAARTGKSFDADAIYTFDRELVDRIYRK